MRFTDKVAIVTGGAAGIGLASGGARLVLADINQAALDAAVPQVQQAGAPAVWASVCNVADENQVIATVQGAEVRVDGGRLDNL